MKTFALVIIWVWNLTICWAWGLAFHSPDVGVVSSSYFLSSDFLFFSVVWGVLGALIYREERKKELTSP